MNTEQAYNTWASQYDTNTNRTRDMEGIALRETLLDIEFETCLEIGCGTGKNTEWLLTKAKQVTAADLSGEMLARAKEKIRSPNVDFICVDILRSWPFPDRYYDLATFSLMLEHIEDLEPVFSNVARSLKETGTVYVGELHPFKQYTGSKARFDTEQGQQVVTCYNHHITDFVNAATKAGLQLSGIKEYFDEENKEIPRLLVLMFKVEGSKK